MVFDRELFFVMIAHFDSLLMSETWLDYQSCMKLNHGGWMSTASTTKLGIGPGTPSLVCLVEIRTGEGRFVSQTGHHSASI